MSVRLATTADVDRIATSLALAFEDDPVMCFLFPNAFSRSRRLTRFFRTGLLVQHLANGAAYTDAESGSAALWAPPGRWRITPAQLLRGAPSLIRALGTRVPAAVRTLAAVEHVHPTPPHYYLAVLGTHPNRQGMGIGSALLRPVLDRCDAEGVGAYLESSKERNVPFYRRHGFEVTAALRLPGGGPTVWPMWRDPRALT